MQEELVNQIKAFHGHMCPGLAMGIRAAEIALERIGKHASDERTCGCCRNRYVRSGRDSVSDRMHLWQRQSDSPRLREKRFHIRPPLRQQSDSHFDQARRMGRLEYGTPSTFRQSPLRRSDP